MTEPENTEEKSTLCECGRDHSKPEMFAIDLSGDEPSVSRMTPEQDEDAKQILERIKDRLGADPGLDGLNVAGLVVITPPKKKDPFTKMAGFLLEKVIADHRRPEVEEIWDEDFLGMFLSVTTAGFYATDDQLAMHSANAVDDAHTMESFEDFFKMVERVRLALEHAKADRDLKQAADEFTKTNKN